MSIIINVMSEWVWSKLACKDSNLSPESSRAVLELHYIGLINTASWQGSCLGMGFCWQGCGCWSCRWLVECWVECSALLYCPVWIHWVSRISSWSQIFQLLGAGDLQLSSWKKFIVAFCFCQVRLNLWLKASLENGAFWEVLSKKLTWIRTSYTSEILNICKYINEHCLFRRCGMLVCFKYLFSIVMCSEIHFHVSQENTKAFPFKQITFCYMGIQSNFPVHL